MVKWGIIGASGRWTDQTFIPAIISASNAEIVAICGRSEDITKKISEKYNITKKYCSHDINDFLADKDIEVVWIATNDATHYQYAIACLSAGKHVLIEKPICQYFTQAIEIYRLANEMNKQVYVDYHNRYNPLHIKYKQMCDDGIFGSIVSIRATFYVKYQFIKEEWKNLNNNIGGWALSHIGTHLIDFMQWFMSNLGALNLAYSKLISPSFNFESEDFCHIVLTNETSNFVGTIECSTGMESDHESCFEIKGTKGYIILNDTFMGSGDFEHKIYGKDKIIGIAEKVNPYQLQIETISNNIANNISYVNKDPCSNVILMLESRIRNS